jgi:hypothetical protein
MQILSFLEDIIIQIMYQIYMTTDFLFEQNGPNPQKKGTVDHLATFTLLK